MRTREELAELWRGNFDKVADHDDAVMELHMEGEDVPEEVLRAAIRKGTLGRVWVPVLGGSALSNRGSSRCWTAVVHYLPDPGYSYGRGTGPQVRDPIRSSMYGGRSLRTDLRVQIDTAEELLFMRVYSGELEKGKTAMNPRTGKR